MWAFVMPKKNFRRLRRQICLVLLARSRVNPPSPPGPTPPPPPEHTHPSSVPMCVWCWCAVGAGALCVPFLCGVGCAVAVLGCAVLALVVRTVDVLPRHELPVWKDHLPIGNATGRLQRVGGMRWPGSPQWPRPSSVRSPPRERGWGAGSRHQQRFQYKCQEKAPGECDGGKGMHLWGMWG